MKDRLEVCPLWRGIMLPREAQSLSVSLQNGFRFFQIPLPAIRWFGLTVYLPSKHWYVRREDYGLTTLHLCTARWVRPCLFADGLACAIEERRTSIPTTYLLVQAYQRLWLARSDDVYWQFTYVDHTIPILAPDRLDVSSRNVLSQGLLPSFTDDVTLSQELSHRQITLATRLGRIPIAQYWVTV